MKKSLIIILIGSFLLGGCNKYLDIVPDELPTEADAFRDRNAAMRYLYACYSPIGGVLTSKYTDGAIDQVTADEVVTPWLTWNYSLFTQGDYSASAPRIYYWSDLYRAIRLCYILLENIDQVPEVSAEERQRFKGEATFLIGYYHFALIRAYGPIVIADKKMDVNMPVSDYPVRSPYDSCVNFAVGKLDEAAQLLPREIVNLQELGRVTSVAAKSIKARLLLYAASPLFNGGGGQKPSLYANFKNDDGTQLISSVYDKEKWKRAANAAKEAIDLAEQAGHKLYESTQFASTYPSDPTEKKLRMVFLDKTVTKEVIWQETEREKKYGFQYKSTPYLSGSAGGAGNGISPTISTVEMFYSKNGLPIDKDPGYNYTNRYKDTTGPNGRTLILNLNREPRFNTWIAYHNSYYEVKRGTAYRVLMQFRRNDVYGRKNRTTDYSLTGYLNKKGVYPLLDQTQVWVSYEYPWPLIRLAELYLNYAEALIEYGQDFSTAKQYIDRVRTRAGIPTVDESWAAVGGANSQETLRDIVRHEKSIEFYLENHRFWDLRRWMVASEYINAIPRGMNVEGTTDADFFQIKDINFKRVFTDRNYLMPIPQAETNKNEKLKQNPGY